MRLGRFVDNSCRHFRRIHIEFTIYIKNSRIRHPRRGSAVSSLFFRSNSKRLKHVCRVAFSRQSAIRCAATCSGTGEALSANLGSERAERTDRARKPLGVRGYMSRNARLRQRPTQSLRTEARGILTARKPRGVLNSEVRCVHECSASTMAPTPFLTCSHNILACCSRAALTCLAFLFKLL